jgi:uncharacterized protein involved in exopolysaccharide biosynthesis
MALSQNYVTVSRRPPDVEDYIDMLRRYRSWIIGPMFAGLVVSTVVAFLWRDTYQSIAVLRIMPQQVSEKLIPTEFSTAMNQRLIEMEQNILSRTTLEGLIVNPALDLYKRDRLERPMEDIVLDMRTKDIDIKMLQTPSGASAEANNRQQMASAFSISFTYPDRFKAQAVVRELVTKFIDQNVQVERDQAKLTSDFLDDELKTAKDNLDKLEDQITQFKVANSGKLPEQVTSNSAMLNSLQIQASTLSSNLQQAIDMKTTLETSLAGQMQSLRYYQDNSEDFVAGGANAPMSVQNQELLSVNNQLTTLQQQLAGQQQSLGANNPAIKTLKAQISVAQKRKEQLERDQDQKERAAAAASDAKQPEAPKKVANKAAENAILQVQNQIEGTKTAIAESSANIKRIQDLQADTAKKIATYEERIQAGPLNERQSDAFARDETLAKAAYDDMVRKKETAETSKNLEERKGGEQLELLDPPSDPQAPIQPKRAIWAAVGTAIGLLLGVALAGGKEMKNTSLKNLKDVRAYTNLPVLSSIPLLENALLVRRKRRLFWVAWTSAFIAGTMLVLGSMYYYYIGQAK